MGKRFVKSSSWEVDLNEVSINKIASVIICFKSNKTFLNFCQKIKFVELSIWEVDLNEVFINKIALVIIWFMIIKNFKVRSAEIL